MISLVKLWCRAATKRIHQKGAKIFGAETENDHCYIFEILYGQTLYSHPFSREISGYLRVCHHHTALGSHQIPACRCVVVTHVIVFHGPYLLPSPLGDIWFTPARRWAHAVANATVTPRTADLRCRFQKHTFLCIVRQYFYFRNNCVWYSRGPLFILNFISEQLYRSTMFYLISYIPRRHVKLIG